MDCDHCSQKLSNTDSDSCNGLSGHLSDSRQTAEPTTVDRQDTESTSTSNTYGESLADGFEVVSAENIPQPESEELLSMNNAPVVTGTLGYLQQLAGRYLAGVWETTMTEATPNFGFFSYFGTFFHDALAYIDDEEVDMVVNTFLNNTPSLKEELRRRECLLRTLSDKCKEIIEELLARGIDIGLLSFLERRGCINKADISYLKGKHEDPITLTRHLYFMMLTRDLRTLLTFVWILKYVSQSLFEKVTEQFNSDISASSGTIPLHCSRCIIIDRVDIHLVTDYLLRCRECNLKKLYQKIIEAKRSESEDLWKELFKNVRSKAMYTEVRDVILEAIKDCGFHSDVLKMLQEDKRLDRNSLECRCNESLASSTDTDNADLAPLSDSEMQNCAISNRMNIEEINDVSSENITSVERTDGFNLQNIAPDNQINSDDLLRKSNSLKRKTSEIGNAFTEVCPKKKSSEFSDEISSCFSESQPRCKHQSCIQNEKTLISERHRALRRTKNIVKSETASVDKEGKCGSANDNDSNNLRMEELKEVVDGQPDSGVSLGPSLDSFRSNNSDNDTDSGWSEQSKIDRHETMRKEIATNRKQSLQEIENPGQIADQNVLRNASATSSSDSIVADHPENSNLTVNNDALIYALNETSMDEEGDESSIGASCNKPERSSENKRNEQTDPNPTNEPFINLMIKGKR